MLDRNRDRHHALAVLGAAHAGPVDPMQGLVDLHHQGALGGRGHRRRWTAHLEVERKPTVIARPSRRQHLPLHPVGDPVAVGDQVALGVEQARALRAWVGEHLQDLAGGLRIQLRRRLAHRGGAIDHVDDQLALGRQTVDARAHQTAPQLVQQQGAGDDDRQPQHVEQDDEAPQARAWQPTKKRRTAYPAGFAGVGLRIRLRGICIRRHTRFRSRRTRYRPRGTSSACA